MEMKLNACESLTRPVNLAGNVATESLRTLTLLVQCDLGGMSAPGNFDLFLLVCVQSLKVIAASRFHFPVGTQINGTLVLELPPIAVVVRDVS